ncbi:MAG TPA: glycine zipper domain-containing protein [Flavisolibacter sp.]|jgi:hypothetical protein|nr:glycine zipper domain-containing protein [Flavisolibacter sp.]
MKKLIPILSLGLIMTACNSTPKDNAAVSGVSVTQPVQPVQDTAGLAQYNEWKAMHELSDAKAYAASLEAKPAVTEVRTITKTVQAPAPKPVKRATPKPVASSNNGAGSSGSGSTANDGSGSMSSGSSQTAEVNKKQGWSKAAKGAVIGGIGGAAAGAVINKKNRVVGAVVGAVLGAGGGYTIGRGMDKKDGRIDYNF